MLDNFIMANFSILFAADVSGVSLKINKKSNEKLVIQNCATLFLSWIPFTSFESSKPQLKKSYGARIDISKKLFYKIQLNIKFKSPILN